MNKLLLAVTLGDGCLTQDGTLEILHCAKQKEYLEYKAHLFEKEIKYKLNNKKYDAYYFRVGTYSKYDGKEIREKLYCNNGHKYFSEEIVEAMDEYCFAILYCDDGSLIPKKDNGKIYSYNLTISTYCSYEECERLVKRIDELFGVKFYIQKDRNMYLLRCGTRAARVFLNQIKQYITNFECFKNNKLKDI